MGKAFALLARFKGLRGTAVDIFSYTEERKMERALIDHYEAQMEMVAAELTPANHAVAVELESLPAQIRGYGHIKEESVEKVRAPEQMVLKKDEEAKREREEDVVPTGKDTGNRTKRTERMKTAKG